MSWGTATAIVYDALVGIEVAWAIAGAIVWGILGLGLMRVGERKE